jgi:hypothetical protein
MNRPDEPNSYDEPSWQELEAELAGHIDAGRWLDAAGTLVAMAELESDSVARAQYLHGAALVFRDRLADPTRAAVLLELTVDTDPRAPRAWHALDQLAVADRDEAAARRRCYGRALAELGDEGEAPLRARLWDRVAALSSECLDDPETAVAALEAAQALAPDPARAERLACQRQALGARDEGKAPAGG